MFKRFEMFFRIPFMMKAKTYKTIILPVILYGCETWHLTLSEEHSLGMFDSRVLRRIFGPKRGGKLQEAVEDCIMRSFIICTLHQVLLG
jgi:hypothetical protein